MADQQTREAQEFARVGAALDAWTKDRLDFVLSTADRDDLTRAVLTAQSPDRTPSAGHVARPARRAYVEPRATNQMVRAFCLRYSGPGFAFPDPSRVRDALTAALATEADDDPTEVEWGVRYRDGERDVDEPADDEATARARVAEMQRGYDWPEEIRLVHRDVPPFREVPTGA